MRRSGRHVEALRVDGPDQNVADLDSDRGHDEEVVALDERFDYHDPEEQKRVVVAVVLRLVGPVLREFEADRERETQPDKTRRKAKHTAGVHENSLCGQLTGAHVDSSSCSLKTKP